VIVGVPVVAFALKVSVYVPFMLMKSVPFSWPVSNPGTMNAVSDPGATNSIACGEDDEGERSVVSKEYDDPAPTV
jgi:hypothetical protein